MSDEKKEKDLFGQTFDQQLKATGGDVEGRDISPNVRVPGEVVFEPIGDNIRVTARDQDHQLLWGYVGSRETLQKVHTYVAIYGRLQDLLREQLDKRGLPTDKWQREPIKDATKALRELQELASNLEDSIDVEDPSEATRKRARIFARIAEDAVVQINQAKKLAQEKGAQGK